MAEVLDTKPDLHSDVAALTDRFSGSRTQPTKDGIPTVWIDRDNIQNVMRFLKREVDNPYELLFDLSGIDERVRQNKQDQPDSDFTRIFLHLGNND